MQAIEGQSGRPKYEDKNLDSVVVSHGTHAAQDRVQPRERDDKNRADPKTVNFHSGDVQAQLREQSAKDHAACKDAHGDFGDDESDERDDRKNVAGICAEAPLQEFRHSENHRAHIKRHENPSQDQEAPGVQLIVRERDATGRASAGQTDYMFRSDVRGEDQCANDPPAKVAPGKKIVRCRILAFLDHPPGNAEQDAEIKRDHRPIQTGDARLSASKQKQSGNVCHPSALPIGFESG